MPVSAINTYTAQKLEPAIYVDGFPVTYNVAYAPGQTVVRGQVLAQLTAAVNEVQTLTIGATGGTYTITYTDPITGLTKTTAALNYNDNAATQAAAMNAAGVLGTSGVAVTSTGPWTYTFSGSAYAGKSLPLLTVNTAALTGGSASFARATAGSPAGAFTAYVNGGSNGAGTAKAIAQYDFTTDQTGAVAIANDSGTRSRLAPVYISGWFRTEDLTTLDATAAGNLGRIVVGTVSNGLLRMY